MKRYLIALLLAAFVIPSTVLAEDPPTEVWVKTFGMGNDDWGEDIAVDASGFIYVTGNIYNGAYLYWCTVKYDADGTIEWYKLYDSGYGDDMATAVAVDNAGNVYVVGWSPDNTIHDWRYIKYDADGNLLWNKIRDWGADVDQGCNDIVVDTVGGYLYMTGEFRGPDGSCDYLTVKCDLDGNLIGENGWSGSTGLYSSGRAIAIDPAGYIYVSGIAGFADLFWVTLKYDMNLNLKWSAVHNSSGAHDHIPAGGTVAVDYAGCIFVVGWVENATADWQIVKYDSGGAPLWSHYIVTNYDEGAWGVAVDSAGYLYVNGDFDTGAGWDCRTVKCDTDGNVLWQVTYDGGYGNDGGRGVAIDDSGFVYVIGHSYRTASLDYLTIKYAQQTGIAEQLPVGHSSILSLEVVNNPTSAPVLRYTLPAAMYGSLSFYTADGRKLEEFSIDPSLHTFTWNVNRLPCGVYFAKLGFGYQSISAKICLTK
jgi:hypothetical protein